MLEQILFEYLLIFLLSFPILSLPPVYFILMIEFLLGLGQICFLIINNGRLDLKHLCSDALQLVYSFSLFLQGPRNLVLMSQRIPVGFGEKLAKLNLGALQFFQWGLVVGPRARLLIGRCKM